MQATENTQERPQNPAYEQRGTLNKLLHRCLSLCCEQAPTSRCWHTAFLLHYTWWDSVDSLHRASTLDKGDMKGALRWQETALQLSAQLAAQLFSVIAEPVSEKEQNIISSSMGVETGCVKRKINVRPEVRNSTGNVLNICPHWTCLSRPTILS